MKKTDLVELAINKGLSKKAANELVGEMLAKMTDTLKSGEKVSLSGFGTFSVSTREKRQGRNPQTGASITIPASKSAKFKQASQLKNDLNGK